MIRPGLVARIQNLVNVELVGTDQLDSVEIQRLSRAETRPAESLCSAPEHERLFPGILLAESSAPEIVGRVRAAVARVVAVAPEKSFA